jgi:hypothetical protein
MARFDSDVLAFNEPALIQAFAQANHRRSLRYTPPGGGPAIACTVILDARDRELEFGRGAAIMQGQILQVRRSELPAPAKGGTFTRWSGTNPVSLPHGPVAQAGHRPEAQVRISPQRVCATTCPIAGSM